MEMDSATHVKSGPLSQGLTSVKALPKKIATSIVDTAKHAKKLGRDDPRRVYHSLKVGLALTVVSLFYYYQPLYDNFGVSAMWAVLTVVVVFEFSVGATLSKGLNRGLATLLAGALGVGAHHLASLSGHVAEPILLGFFVFVQAAVSTFLRFFPKIKARYDYGMLIFILTFALVSVSGFREDEILELAHKRLTTILIGGSACIIIAICVCPVWAGEDLHKLIALNMEKLGSFLEGFGEVHLNKPSAEERKDEKKTPLNGYQSVLTSKNTEDVLANLAKWEPGHGKFLFRHPWAQYLKIGTLNRQCGYRIEALSSYLNSDLLAPEEIKEEFETICGTLSLECGKALNELSRDTKKMTKPSGVAQHISNAKAAAKTLNSLLKSDLWADMELLDLVPTATAASLLIDLLICTEQIYEAVVELASKADFKAEVEPTVSPEMRKQGQMEGDKERPNRSKSSKVVDCCPDNDARHHVIINVDDGSEPEVEKEGGIIVAEVAASSKLAPPPASTVNIQLA
uniref:Aluminum-activated malate transporter n=1 Tax=Kalanchoe fedtschenkoi TaxID=63787 RepID=A0A7N0RGL8_KALFE